MAHHSPSEHLHLSVAHEKWLSLAPTTEGKTNANGACIMFKMLSIAAAVLPTGATTLALGIPLENA